MDTYSVNGYVGLTVNGKLKYQHVCVAEEVLGRELKKGEVVHHINEIRSDNTPENLLVFASNSDHSRFHAYGLDESYLRIHINGSWSCDLREEDFRQCKTCGVRFKIGPNKKHFCSVSCFNLHRKSNIEKDLDKLIRTIKSLGYVKTGQQYGVSDNAIRKWVRRYGLDPKKIKKISKGHVA